MPKRFVLLIAAFVALPLTLRAEPVPDTLPHSVSAAGSTLRQADARVGGIAYRLALRGRPECGEAYPLSGLLLHHLAEYEPADRPLMIERHALDRAPGILSVIDGGAAAKAGLAAGDLLLAVNRAALPSPLAIAAEPKRAQRRLMIEASEMQLEQALRQGAAELRITRDARELSLVLRPDEGCLGRVRLARSKQVNAFANGRYVTMTTAMLDFAQSDDELAFILAHELAHNILGHDALLDAQGVPERGLLRGIGKNASRVWKTEEEADRLALRLMWRAGYDLDVVLPFWRRLYGKYDVFPQLFRTHPSLKSRERIYNEERAMLPLIETPSQ